TSAFCARKAFSVSQNPPSANPLRQGSSPKEAGQRYDSMSPMVCVGSLRSQAALRQLADRTPLALLPIIQMEHRNISVLPNTLEHLYQPLTIGYYYSGVLYCSG